MATLKPMVDQTLYQYSEKFIREMDAEDGGLSGLPTDVRLQTALAALASGLRSIENKESKTHSAWDAFVMLNELFEEITTNPQTS